MASLTDLARLHTRLDPEELAHLKRLVGSWGLLSDFCFGDLLLFAPVFGPDGQPDDTQFAVLAQIRPTTAQTLYREDWVGGVVPDAERPLVARCFRQKVVLEGEITIAALHERVRVLGIPVLFEGRVIAVLSRELASTSQRVQGELELTYVEVFDRFATMIAEGTFPFADEDQALEHLPRVGDGVIVTDGETRVVFTSPNAVSALHRAGIHSNAEGMMMRDLGLESTAVRDAFEHRIPTTEEVEPGPNLTMLVRCLPLVAAGEVTGSVVLVRDISELRRRDRLLVSKDATIREIHHRVKNNLQTISSLLRLQGRRLESPEAKATLDESVRRIRSIALVHETLSRGAGDDVPFIEIVRPLVAMVQEGLLGPDGALRFTVHGDERRLPSLVATPLAVVVTELLQNAVDHGYPGGMDQDLGEVQVSLLNDGVNLTIRVHDDGVGVPDGFELASGSGLGLTIVRTLIESELQGSIQVGDGREQGPSGRYGTEFVVTVPLENHKVRPEDPAERSGR